MLLYNLRANILFKNTTVKVDIEIWTKKCGDEFYKIFWHMLTIRVPTTTKFSHLMLSTSWQNKYKLYYIPCILYKCICRELSNSDPGYKKVVFLSLCIPFYLPVLIIDKKLFYSLAWSEDLTSISSILIPWHNFFCTLWLSAS